MQQLQYVYKVKSDSEYVTFFKKKNINSTVKGIVP